MFDLNREMGEEFVTGMREAALKNPNREMYIKCIKHELFAVICSYCLFQGRIVPFTTFSRAELEAHYRQLHPAEKIETTNESVVVYPSRHPQQSDRLCSVCRLQNERYRSQSAS